MTTTVYRPAPIYTLLHDEYKLNDMQTARLAELRRKLRASEQHCRDLEGYVARLRQQFPSGYPIPPFPPVRTSDL